MHSFCSVGSPSVAERVSVSVFHRAAIIPQHCLQVKEYVLINRHARDQWHRAAQSIPLNIAEGNGKQSLKDKNRFFKIARGSASECASIHDLLRVCNAIDPESDCHGKLNLKRIVSMLTRLIQRTQSVSEGSIEYE